MASAWRELLKQVRNIQGLSRVMASMVAIGRMITTSRSRAVSRTAIAASETRGPRITWTPWFASSSTSRTVLSGLLSVSRLRI